MNTKGVVILALGGVTFILLAASCGGVEWLNFEGQICIGRNCGPYTKTESGLWRVCREAPGRPACGSISSSGLADWYGAVRAFSILSVLACVAGIAATLLFIIEKLPGIIPGAIFLGAGVCGIICMSVYTEKTSMPSQMYSYGWSYFLGWVGTVFSGITGIIAIVIGLKSSSVSS